MREYIIKNFDKGTVDRIEGQSIPAEAASASLDFLTNGDRVELRRGYKILGTSLSGVGAVTGLHVAEKSDGTEILYWTHGKKLKYYDETTEDHIEVGSDQLGTDADGEDVAMADYHDITGGQLWICSPNSSLYKIMTANPGSITDVYDATKTGVKGLIMIKQNRLWMWDSIKDKTGLYLSHIDDANSNSTAVADEVVGALGSITYTGTLTFKAGNPQATCYGIIIYEVGGETFTDNFSGVLTGDAGGTGTINYTTGEYSVTFNAITTGAVTVDYSWFDPVTGKGLSDLTYSATRLAGEGDVIRQDDEGSPLKSIMAIGNTEYCLHQKKTWSLTLTSDDTNATNYVYRDSVGIPNWRASVATGSGIFVVDDSTEKEPKIRLLQLDAGSSEVIPVTISNSLDLSGYKFSKCAAIEWGNYMLFACRTSDSDYNNRVILYNKLWKSWDILHLWVSCWAIYNGALVAGDSIANNVYEMFSKTDDDDSEILGSWESSITNLEVEALKKCKKLRINGRIQPDQSVKVSASIDRGGYVEVGYISGTGSYVDSGTSISVGAVTVGKDEVGGGGDGITAFNYSRQFKLKLDKFKEIKIKFEPESVGWFDVSQICYHDLRIKAQKLPNRYR